MTYADIIMTSPIVGKGDGVRRMIGDVNSVQWTDAQLLRFLGDAVREIMDVRPDAQFDDNGNAVEFDFPTDPAQDFPIAEKWATAAMFYAAWRVFKIDYVDSASGWNKTKDMKASYDAELAR